MGLRSNVGIVEKSNYTEVKAAPMVDTPMRHALDELSNNLMALDDYIGELERTLAMFLVSDEIAEDGDATGQNKGEYNYGDNSFVLTHVLTSIEKVQNLQSKVKYLRGRVVI